MISVELIRPLTSCFKCFQPFLCVFSVSLAAEVDKKVDLVSSYSYTYDEVDATCTLIKDLIILALSKLIYM